MLLLVLHNEVLLMAYITTQAVKEIRQALKAAYPKLKFSVTKDSSNSSVSVKIVSGDIDFAEDLTTNGYCGINQYHLNQYGSHQALFEKIINIIKFSSVIKWYDLSDVSSDYFSTAFYIHLSVGSYDKPYQLK